MKRFILIFSLLLFVRSAYAAAWLQVSSLWREDGAETMQMRLPASPDLKMALFRRNGYTYFIFKSDRNIAVNSSELEGLPIVQIPHTSSTILRGVFAPDMTPVVQAQNHILRLQMQKEVTPQKSLFETKWVPNGLLLELNNAEVIDFVDPNTLENLVVFLTPFSPVFITQKYDTPEMTVLPTFQGVAIYPKTTAFNLLSDKEGFVIFPQNPKSLKPMKSVKNDSAAGINWNAYKTLTPQDVDREIQSIKDFIFYVKPSAQERLRQEMAVIYLSQGFVEPALEILSKAPESPQKTELMFLSYVLQDKPKPALKEWAKIENPPLYLKLWKSAVDDEALSRIEDFEILSLPDKLAVIFWSKIAQKADAQNNFLLLAMAVDKLEQLPLTGYEKQTFLYLKGQIAEKENDPTSALQFYNQALALPYLQMNGKISFAKTNVELNAFKITPKQAISEFEKMRALLDFTELEIPLLQTLILLYNEQNDPLQALRIDRELLSITQDVAILKRMQRRYERFFISHMQQNPFKHVALYNEFKELMPVGIKGAQIKQHLIDDFIALDLLPDAYDLAMDLSDHSNAAFKQKAAVQAYLTALILNDGEKIKKAEKKLPDDWKQLSKTFSLSPLLKWKLKNI